jgi:hypothetical protein
MRQIAVRRAKSTVQLTRERVEINALILVHADGSFVRFIESFGEPGESQVVHPVKYKKENLF